MRRHALVTLAALACLIACDPDSRGEIDGGAPPGRDAGAARDSGRPVDAEVRDADPVRDGSTFDGSTPDAGDADAGADGDAGAARDGGAAADSGGAPRDAGTDAGADAGTDAGPTALDAGPPPRADHHVHIDVSNTCEMTVTPTEMFVPRGQTAYFDWHNHSRDYPVDVWMSYGGGFTDLRPGATWDEPISHCGTPFVGTRYADISTACSSFRFLIHCL